MNTSVPSKADAGCGGSCHGCGAPGQADATPGAWSGWRFALAASTVFLLPLVLAMAGAVLAAGSPLRQLAGAGGGLALGVLLAKGLVLLVPRDPTRTHGACGN